MNMTRYEMTKINFIETIPWSSLHLYFDIWHLISPSELLRRGPKWRKLTSLWPIHEIKFTTFIFRDLTSYFAIRIATARSKNDQSRLHCEPSFTLSKIENGKYHWRRTNGEHYSDEIEGRRFYNYALLRRLDFSFRRKNPVFSRIIITMMLLMIMMMMMRMIYQGQGLNNFAEQLV